MALTIKIPYRAFWWVPVIVVVLLVLLYVSAWLDMWGGPDQYHTANLTNVKQLSLAMLMYQADNDGLFPPQMSTTDQLKRALIEYTKTDKLFLTVNEREGDILGNGRLAGRLAESVVDPDKTIMLYDPELWKDTGERACGFVDGHAKYVDDDYFEWGLKVEYATPLASR